MGILLEFEVISGEEFNERARREAEKPFTKRMKETIALCVQTEKEILAAEGHVDRRGFYDYDKIPVKTAEMAVRLLNEYAVMCRKMIEIKREKERSDLFEKGKVKPRNSAAKAPSGTESAS